LTEERAFWLAWAQVSGVGPVLLQRLQQHFGTLTAAWQASSAALQAVEGMGTQTLEQVNAARSQLHPAEFLVSHAAQNPHFWTPADSHEYPRLLLEIASPPPVLYYRGIVDEGENQGGKALIGIVGTRSPSEYGKRWTRKISMALARNGFTVVSGLAEGKVVWMQAEERSRFWERELISSIHLEIESFTSKLSSKV
jgi:DNA processing protein